MSWLKRAAKTYININKKAAENFKKRGVAAIALGGPVVAAIELGKAVHDELKPEEALNQLPAPIDKQSENFIFLYASVLARIDGELVDEEKRLLESFLLADNRFSEQDLENLLKKTTFNEIRKYYSAIENPNSVFITKALNKLVQADRKQTPEEECGLIQWGHLSRGYERIELFVVSENANTHNELLSHHDLFQYITNEKIQQDFPKTEQMFDNDTMLCFHPYYYDKLVIYKEINAVTLYNSFCDDIIQVLKALGVKKIEIFEEELDGSDQKNQNKASASYKNPTVKVAYSHDVNFSSITESNNSSSVLITFDGNFEKNSENMPFGSEKKLIDRFKSNPQFKELVLGRLGENKIKTFEYKAKTDKYEQIDRSVEVAMEVGVNINQGSVAIENDNMKSKKEIRNRVFKAEFY